MEDHHQGRPRRDDRHGESRSQAGARAREADLRQHGDADDHDHGHAGRERGARVAQRIAQCEPCARRGECRADRARDDVEGRRDAARRLDPTPECVGQQQRGRGQQRQQVEAALAARQREEEQGGADPRQQQAPCAPLLVVGARSEDPGARGPRHGGREQDPGQRLDGELPRVVVERPRMRGAGEEAADQVLDDRFAEESLRRECDRRRDPDEARRDREHEAPPGERARQIAQASLPGEKAHDHEQRDEETDGPLGQHGEAERRVQAELRDAAPADAAVQTPERGQRERLEEGEQHVELCAPRVVRELEGGEQQRGAERRGGASEQARAEHQRDADQRDASQRRRQARGRLPDVPERRSRRGREPVVEWRLLCVGLAVQVQQHEPARPELHRSQRLRDVSVAWLVRRPQARGVEPHAEQQQRAREEHRLGPTGSPVLHACPADVTFALAEVPHGVGSHPSVPRPAARGRREADRDRARARRHDARASASPRSAPPAATSSAASTRPSPDSASCA